MRGRLQTAECRLLSNAVNSVEAGDFSTALEMTGGPLSGPGSNGSNGSEGSKGGGGGFAAVCRLTS